MYVLDDHDQEGQLNAKSLVGVGGACDEGSSDIGPHDLQHRGLDVLIGQPLDVAILDWISSRILFLSQIWRGLLPMLYRIERNPDW